MKPVLAKPDNAWWDSGAVSEYQHLNFFSGNHDGPHCSEVWVKGTPDRLRACCFRVIYCKSCDKTPEDHTETLELKCLFGPGRWKSPYKSERSAKLEKAFETCVRNLMISTPSVFERQP